MATPTQKLLEKGREILARRSGWTKGTMVRITGGFASYCAAGAIGGEVAVRPRGYRTAYRLLTKAAGGDIIVFNDRQATRKKDILAVFDRAIKLAGAK